MSEAVREHLTWDNFLQYYLAPGVPATHPIPGSPQVELFVSEGGSQVGLRVRQATAPESLELPLSAVEFVVFEDPPGHVLEVRTEHSDLFRPFFGVLLELADAIQIQGADVSAAIMAAMSRLNVLAGRKTRLPEEKARGLMGELWVLARLLEGGGQGMAKAWLGADSESHDFRFGDLDLEVKATAQARRVHMIGSPHQLVPSGDRPLFLVSVHLARTGSGTGLTLPGMVDAVLSFLPPGSQGRELVDAALTKLNYRDADRSLYDTAYHLRSDPQAYDVSDGFPRITPDALRVAVGSDLVGRIDRVTYSVDIDDMEPTVSAGELIANELEGGVANGA